MKCVPYSFVFLFDTTNKNSFKSSNINQNSFNQVETIYTIF